MGGSGADRLPRLHGQVVGGHHHQAGGLERAGPADRIERVLQVVGAGGDVDARLPQGRQIAVSPRGIGDWPRPWRNRLVWGSTTTLMSASATRSAVDLLHLERLLAEADAVAGGGAEVESRRARGGRARRARSTLGSSVSSVWRSTARPWSVAICEQRVGGALDVAVAGVGLEVRAPADQVGAGVERLDDQAALVGAGRCP